MAPHLPPSDWLRRSVLTDHVPALALGVSTESVGSVRLEPDERCRHRVHDLPEQHEVPRHLVTVETDGNTGVEVREVKSRSCTRTLPQARVSSAKCTLTRTHTCAHAHIVSQHTSELVSKDQSLHAATEHTNTHTHTHSHTHILPHARIPSHKHTLPCNPNTSSHRHTQTHSRPLSQARTLSSTQTLTRTPSHT